MVFSMRQQKHFTSNNAKAHRSMNLFANWMRPNNEKVRERFLDIDGCQAEITTEVMCLDLAESNIILV